MRSVVVLPEPDGPEQHEELARLDREVDAVQHGRRAVPLDDAFEADAPVSIGAIGAISAHRALIAGLRPSPRRRSGP